MKYIPVRQAERVKLYAILKPLTGDAMFAFNARDDEDADSLMMGWVFGHGMVRSDGHTCREIQPTAEDLADLRITIQNDWVLRWRR